MRARGREDLARRLAERGFSQAAVREALDRLESEAWLDDLGAARSLVRGAGSKYGRARIERELSARGFSPEAVAAALSELSREREEDALSRAFARISRSLAGVEAEKRRRRIWNALVRRGFRAEAISAIMKDADEID